MTLDNEIEVKIKSLISDLENKKYQTVILKALELIKTNNKIPVIFNILGVSYSLIDKHKEAINAYKSACLLDPKNDELFRNIGKSYTKLNLIKEANDSFDTAIKIKPSNPDAYFGKGVLLLQIKDLENSLRNFEKTIELNPSFYQAYYNIGIVQNLLGNLYEAQTNYIRAININENYFQAFNNLGVLLIKLKKNEDAINVLKRAIEIRSNYEEALTNLGVAYLDLKKYKESLIFFNKVININPNNVKAICQKLFLMRKICNWNDDKHIQQNLKTINDSSIEVTPWQLLSLDDDPKVELNRARKYGKQFGYKNSNFNHNNSKIKVAYFTPDFHEHAGMMNMEGIFKHHNKDKFEIIGFDYGYNNDDNTHERIKKYFDKFFYISDFNDKKINELATAQKIDIAIHRNGYSQLSRNSLFANRLAPLQISFLGYPGTMGVDYIDYIIADKTVIPSKFRKYFSEKIIYLPNTYFPTFNQRKISEKTYSRKDFEINEDAFVFGCFNNTYKITHKEFSIWMKLLNKTNNSFLILLTDNKLTRDNIIKEIKNFNIDQSKVKFLENIKNEDHLARHQLIDLYLDTFNYNGHTSAIDALYSNIPVISKIGNTFTARVCASILKACGLDELVCETENQYYALAYELAKNEEKFTQLKSKLKKNINMCSLFDTAKYVDTLEKGLIKAHEKKRNQDLVEDILI